MGRNYYWLCSRARGALATIAIGGNLRIVHEHPWDVTPAEGRRIQDEMRDLVSAVWEEREIRTVAGIDVGLEGDKAQAAVVVLRFPDLEPMEASRAEVEVKFPYIPGLLAFREAPAILAAGEKLRTEPDLLIVDGQGIAHPRRLGIASHLGVMLDKPAIGCAKSLLIGTYNEPPSEAGSFSYLYDGDEIIGAVVRTRANVQPVYVSVGHRIDLENAIKLVLACTRGYRLPEPVRWAHRVADGESLPRAAEGEQKSLFEL